MVDTIDPVSFRQDTGTPPTSTFKWGHDDIKFDLKLVEPGNPPPELWLDSSVGASFPPTDEGETAHRSWSGLPRRPGHEGGPVARHNLVQNGQAVGTICI